MRIQGCLNNKTSTPRQLIGYALQKRQALGLDAAGRRGRFDRTARLLLVAAVVETALPGQAAQIGEVMQQIGGVQMVQAEGLQAGGVD